MSLHPVLKNEKDKFVKKSDQQQIKNLIILCIETYIWKQTSIVFRIQTHFRLLFVIFLLTDPFILNIENSGEIIACLIMHAKKICMVETFNRWQRRVLLSSRKKPLNCSSRLITEDTPRTHNCQRCIECHSQHVGELREVSFRDWIFLSRVHQNNFPSNLKL